MFHMSIDQLPNIKSAGLNFGLRAWIYRSILGLSTLLLIGFTGIFGQVHQSVEKEPETLPPLAQAAPLKENISWWKDLKSFVASPLFTDEDRIKSLTAEDILSDSLDRIGPDFSVPKPLKKRTAFWFDIYTKYGKYEHVIHHLRYPWIIYKVVDGSSIIETGKGPLWLRRKRINQLVQKEKVHIRKALKRLANRKSHKKLSKTERRLVNVLKDLPGKRRNVYKYATKTIRSQLGQKDFFVAGLRRSSKYLPIMEKEFQQMDLPLELTRMPFVESSFNERAESKVGASGIWQIMPRTGRAYSIVNKYIDERNSPLKATLTAGKVLRNYKRALKKWPLAITSYNHGIGNIRKAIKAARSTDISTIIKRYHQGEFKFASSNFYAGFLAALHAEKYQDALFENVVKEPLLNFVEIHLGQRIRVKQLLKISGLSKKDLLYYNLDLKMALRKNYRLPKGYRLHLPPEKADAMIERISKNIKIKARQAST